MYTTIRHEPQHTRKAWPGTPVEPCLLTGTGYVNINDLVSTYSQDAYRFWACNFLRGSVHLLCCSKIGGSIV